MATGPADLGDDALVRRTPSRVPCRERLRRSRPAFPSHPKRGFRDCRSSHKARDGEIEPERAGNCRSDVIFLLEMQRLVILDESFLWRKQPDKAAQSARPTEPPGADRQGGTAPPVMAEHNRQSTSKVERAGD